MRNLYFLILSILCYEAYGNEACFDGSSGVNGHKNLTEICLLGNDKAKVKTYYFNNLLPSPSTICEAHAKIDETSTGFELNTEAGMCENDRALEATEIKCDSLSKTSYRCIIKKYNVEFHIFKENEISI